MYVSGVQGPSWFGKLQVFNAWHFSQGSQRLLDQVGGESISFENLMYVVTASLWFGGGVTDSVGPIRHTSHSHGDGFGM